MINKVWEVSKKKEVKPIEYPSIPRQLANCGHNECTFENMLCDHHLQEQIDNMSGRSNK